MITDCVDCDGIGTVECFVCDAVMCSDHPCGKYGRSLCQKNCNRGHCTRCNMDLCYHHEKTCKKCNNSFCSPCKRDHICCG